MSQKAIVRSVVAVMFALGALASAVAQMPGECQEVSRAGFGGGGEE